MSGEATGGLTIIRVAALALAIGGGAFLVWRGQSAPSAPAPAPAPQTATAPAPVDAAPPAARADGGADGGAHGGDGGGPDGGAGADAAPAERLPDHLMDSSKSGGARLIMPGLE